MWRSGKTCAQRTLHLYKGRERICSAGETLRPKGLAPRPPTAALIEGVGAQRTTALIIRSLHNERGCADDDHVYVRGGTKVGVRQGAIG